MTAPSWDDMRGDIFDSRDIIERIADLEATLEDVTGDEAIEAAAELAILQAIQADAMTAPDWRYGVTFIPDAEWEDYARQLAEDIGAIDSEAGWPLSFIDWPAAAEALQQDYTAYTFDGLDYWGRA